MLKYKGYVGTVDVDTEHNILHGSVINARDVITYESETAEGLHEEFVTSIEVYLESCKEDGVEPNKPYSGNFNLRLGEELHRRAAVAAQVTGTSLNTFIKNCVEADTRQFA
ncbi:MAG: type II toxin-antitoxin system HicB family antitoxin [Candidatus Hydrogenedentes bacterium]|nr:type II toxin-antitoxin system HicB family antitoxin [Candidatus Hydrogenedentota bacterium]